MPFLDVGPCAPYPGVSPGPRSPVLLWAHRHCPPLCPWGGSRMPQFPLMCPSKTGAVLTRLLVPLDTGLLLSCFDLIVGESVGAGLWGGLWFSELWGLTPTPPLWRCGAQPALIFQPGGTRCLQHGRQVG